MGDNLGSSSIEEMHPCEEEDIKNNEKGNDSVVADVLEEVEDTCSSVNEEAGKNFDKNVDNSSDKPIETTPQASTESGAEETNPSNSLRNKFSPLRLQEEEEQDDEYSAEASRVTPRDSIPETRSRTNESGPAIENQSPAQSTENSTPQMTISPGAHHSRPESNPAELELESMTSWLGNTPANQNNPNNRDIEHDAGSTSFSGEAVGGAREEALAQAYPVAAADNVDRNKKCFIACEIPVWVWIFILLLIMIGSTVLVSIFVSKPKRGSSSGEDETVDTIVSIPAPTTNPEPSLQARTTFPSPSPTESSVVLSEVRWVRSAQTLRGNAGNAQFGRSMAFSKDGSMVAVGGRPLNKNEPGFVEVRRVRADGTLERLGRPLLGFNYQGGRYSGGGIALSQNGSRMAIGVGSLDHASKTGSVSVLDYDEGLANWVLVGSSPIVGSSSEESFGSSIAMSSDGSIVAVAAPRNDTNGKGAGAVRVFLLDEDGERNWRQMGGDLLGQRGDDEFGTDISMSSDGLTLAVGATQLPRNGTGEVRVFAWNNSAATWEQVGEAFTGEKSREHFGVSVSLSADGARLAVGAPFRDAPPDLINAGQVLLWDLVSVTGVYEKFDKRTMLTGENTNDLFGYSVDLSDDGKTCVVGIPIALEESLESNNKTKAGSGHCCGRVAIYQHDNCRSWFPKGQQTAGTVPNGQYGWTVKISGKGNSFVSSAPFTDWNGNDSGEVWLYYEEGRDEWEQMGQTLMGSGANDGFGWSIALSGDGSVLSAAAALGDIPDGYDFGYTGVYHFDGNHWELKGNRLIGTKPHSFFGFGIGLSGDGSMLAVGQSEGTVNVFSFEEAIFDWMPNAKFELEASGDDPMAVAVAISEDGLVLAASTWSDDEAGYRAGSLSVYRRENRSAMSWSQMGSTIFGGNNEGFGSSIALSSDGQTVAAGYGASMYEIVSSGGVRVYKYTADVAGGKWTKVGQDLTGFALETPWSLLRLSLNSNGTVLAVGSFVADIYNSTIGSVSVYQLSSDGKDWEKLSNSIPGASVALRDTSEGLLLAIGVPFHARGLCKGTGMIRVFVWEESSQSWKQIGNDIVGKEDSDTLGTSVALSADGMVVVGGGPLSDKAGQQFSGIVEAFRRVSWGAVKTDYITE